MFFSYNPFLVHHRVLDLCPLSHRFSKLSQCTRSIIRRFGLLLRPSSGSVIQNSTKNKPPHHVSFLVEFCITDPEKGLSSRPKCQMIDCVFK